ncbi:hypothetical protein ES703_105444 [subsurface metagenome]
MAKLKTPILGFGAKGTIGEALTFQRIPGRNIVREKPIPKDPYTLPQAYHRWDYQDYLAQWATLSNSEKWVYSAIGSRTHNTSVGAFIKEKLKGLPDLALRLHMDEASGAVCRDSSKNGYLGTYFGTRPVPGIIGTGRWFDGVNDRVVFTGVMVPRAVGNIFTVSAWVKTASVDKGVVVHQIAPIGAHEYILRIQETGHPFFLVYDIIHSTGITALHTVNDGQWHLVSGVKDGATLRILIDDYVSKEGATGVGPILGGDRLGIGRQEVAGTQYFHGYMDEVAVRTRALTLAQHTQMSDRRYPI